MLTRLILSVFFLFSVCCTALSAPTKYVNYDDGVVSVLKNEVGNPAKWDPRFFPLVVDIAPGLSAYEYREIDKAINAWETATGLDLFEPQITYSTQDILNPSAGHVSIRYGDLTKSAVPTAIGGTTPYYVVQYPELVHSMVVVLDLSLINSKYIYGTVVHELGHVLLLDHDAYVGSIMVDSATAEKGAKILPKHVYFVRQMHGPELD